MDLQKKFAYVDPSRDPHLWIASVKRYWRHLRQSKRGYPVSQGSSSLIDSNADDFKSHQLCGPILPVEDSTTSIGTNTMQQLDDHFETVAGFGEPYKLQLNGFLAINKLIKYNYPGDMCLSINGSPDKSDWGSESMVCNPCFHWDDNPLAGWSREVVVRSSGKTMGDTDVVYIPPERSRRLRNRLEVSQYLQRKGLSAGLVTRFDYRPVFCVCLQPTGEEGTSNMSNYIECSLGVAGCRGWIHPECVGLGSLADDDIAVLDKLICPFCTTYLEATDMIAEYPDAKK